MHMYTCLDPDKHVYVRIYIMGDAYVYVQYITGTCTRANIYIFLMLLRLTVHIYIHAKIYITAYYLLFDFTKPYSGRPPHRANIGQA